MSTNAPDSDAENTPSIEEYMHSWVTYEGQKTEYKDILKTIGKSQMPATKAIRSYMEDNNIVKLDCGSGWFMTCKAAEKVSFGEDVCSQYMQPEELALLKRENTKRKVSYKIVHPKKRKKSQGEE